VKAFKYIKLISKFFILGLIIIIGALLLNLIAEILGFYTWYDLFINTEEAVNNIGIIDVIFIFIIYPISLGVLASLFNHLLSRKTSSPK